MLAFEREHEIQEIVTFAIELHLYCKIDSRMDLTARPGEAAPWGWRSLPGQVAVAAATAAAAVASCLLPAFCLLASKHVLVFCVFLICLVFPIFLPLGFP